MNDFQSNRQRDNRGSREMFSAVCSQCGANCQVPFRPTGDKPIYCSGCYEKLGNNSNSWSYGENRPQRPSFGNRNRGDNRSFSGNRDFGGSRNFSNNRSGGDNKQMEMVVNKLDRIIELLENQKKVVEKDEKVTKKKVKSKEKKK